MLAFIVSLDDFVITFFVSGAGATTLPVYIFSMIRIGITPDGECHLDHAAAGLGRRRLRLSFLLGRRFR